MSLDTVACSCGKYKFLYNAPDAAYVLHCFQKKTQQTSEKD
ncbi:MAG: type II toxin-antitoxin system RelE/ParE family toxin, partial [Acidobacteriota bacterium]